MCSDCESNCYADKRTHKAICKGRFSSKNTMFKCNKVGLRVYDDNPSHLHVSKIYKYELYTLCTHLYIKYTACPLILALVAPGEN